MYQSSTPALFPQFIAKNHLKTERSR